MFDATNLLSQGIRTAGQSLLTDVLLTMSTGKEGANAARGSLESTDPYDFTLLRRNLYALTSSCAESLDKVVQHFHGEDAWMIGPLPNSLPLADGVEAQARAFLANTHLNAEQLREVANVLKAAGDLRAAGRGARQALQLAQLIRHDSQGAQAVRLVVPVAECAATLGKETAAALAKMDLSAARNAALLYRGVDQARAQAEAHLRGSRARAQFDPTLLRMTRAAVWNMTVAGEGMARVAARVASRDD